MSARHRANHVSIAYVTDAVTADHALQLKAAMFHVMGVRVFLCGAVLEIIQATGERSGQFCFESFNSTTLWPWTLNGESS
jgi:hypothetical protein